MKISPSKALLVVLCELLTAEALIISPSKSSHKSLQNLPPRSFARNSKLYVSVGIGPGEVKQEEAEKELVAGVDYEIPNHENFRTSRRSKTDEQSDMWFSNLLGDDNSRDGVLGDLIQDARDIFYTPVPLLNEERLPLEDEEWTPYVPTKLPWTPLLPAYGLEQFGIPIPRRNAETWRQFDVVGMVGQDYSNLPEGTGTELKLTDDEVDNYKQKLQEKGGWLNDDVCSGRLVYINGRFAPQLSKTDDSLVTNVDDINLVSDEAKKYLARLTDGFTDTLAAPVPINDGEYFFESHKDLSGPDHNVGEPTSQFAINTQQGTAAFAALNTIKTGAVAYVHATDKYDSESETKPIIIVNAQTNDGGYIGENDDDDNFDTGVALHPRTLVVAEDGSRLSVVQSCVDLDDTSDRETHRPKLYNGYTQFFVKGGANVTHSYIDESGGIVTAEVEKSNNHQDFKDLKERPRETESKRPALKDTHLEAIDVHVIGEKGIYEGTMMTLGGSGRVRVAMSVTLLKPGSEAGVNGFSLSGGAQRTDMKTNIHHIADGTQSRQVQKNMIGGRATGAFRGRIRVEQSAQQTASEQVSRTILLSDGARAWSIPSLEIIADDVTCTHGATVSDLSEEELFYLRSRGLDRKIARNLLMYSFAGDISNCVAPAMLGRVDSEFGLQKRVINRLENLVPRGNRAVKGEFSSV